MAEPVKVIIGAALSTVSVFVEIVEGKPYPLLFLGDTAK